ncbi:virulence RhuM family protein [Oscillospiraceae bacterium N12]|uniref:Virulence RhuM family protein n=1 Tax=Jilunia laotingensis TaxID=2763675 RepID=A0A926IQH9_9BACT|nr:virulence RhuM family protein [Jilunia laotingensis]
MKEVPTVAKFTTVQNEGERTVSRQVEYYNLELVTSVGYRVYTHALLFFTNSSLMKRKVAFAYNKHNELLK